jgi:glycosyltransferase involved in cell wall biosynthesis
VLLQRAIESVTSQAYRPIEIVLIDNCSKKSVEVSDKSIEGVTFVIKRNLTSLTAAENRNLGISSARGEYVCFLDDDDYYLPGKIPVLVDYLSGHPSVSFVYSNTQMIGADGVDLGVCRDWGGLVQLMRYRFVHMNSFLVRRDVLTSIRFDENMTTYEDVDFQFRIFENYECSHIDQVYSVWNRDNRPDQLTNKNWPRAKKNWLILCIKFSHIIDQHWSLVKFYYSKMLMLSLLTWDFVNAVKYLVKIISGLFLFIKTRKPPIETP